MGISAYKDVATPGMDETYPVATLADPPVTEVTGATDGGLKALCEQAAARCCPLSPEREAEVIRTWRQRAPV